MTAFKEGPERLQDPCDRPKHGVQVEAGPRAIIEGYVCGELAFHVHLGLRNKRLDMDLGDYCARFHRPTEPHDPKQFVGLRDGNLGHGFPNGKQQGRYYSVLVGVGKNAQSAKRGPLNDVVSLVRLLPLDQCELSQADARESLAQLIPETEFGVIDREVNILPSIARQRRATPTGENELIGEMVKGRPEIVDNLTDHHAPPEYGCLPRLYDDEVVVRSLRVELRDDAYDVSWVPGTDLNLAVQSFQLFFGPVPFLPTPVELVPHDG